VAVAHTNAVLSRRHARRGRRRLPPNHDTHPASIAPHCAWRPPHPALSPRALAILARSPGMRRRPPRTHTRGLEPTRSKRAVASSKSGERAFPPGNAPPHSASTPSHRADSRHPSREHRSTSRNGSSTPRELRSTPAEHRSSARDARSMPRARASKRALTRVDTRETESMSVTGTFVCSEKGDKSGACLSEAAGYKRQVGAWRGASAKEELDPRTRSLLSAPVGLLSETVKRVYGGRELSARSHPAPIPALQRPGQVSKSNPSAASLSCYPYLGDAAAGNAWSTRL
jgi:hypothetical protein